MSYLMLEFSIIWSQWCPLWRIGEILYKMLKKENLKKILMGNLGIFQVINQVNIIDIIRQNSAQYGLNGVLWGEQPKFIQNT